MLEKCLINFESKNNRARTLKKCAFQFRPHKSDGCPLRLVRTRFPDIAIQPVPTAQCAHAGFEKNFGQK